MLREVLAFGRTADGQNRVFQFRGRHSSPAPAAVDFRPKVPHIEGSFVCGPAATSCDFSNHSENRDRPSPATLYRPHSAAGGPPAERVVRLSLFENLRKSAYMRGVRSLLHGRVWRPATRPCLQLRRTPSIRAFRTPAHAGISSSRSIGGRSRRRRNGHENLRFNRRGRLGHRRGGDDLVLARAQFSPGAPGPIRARSRRMRSRSGGVTERLQVKAGMIFLALAFQPHFSIS